VIYWRLLLLAETGGDMFTDARGGLSHQLSMTSRLTCGHVTQQVLSRRQLTVVIAPLYKAHGDVTR